MRWPTRSLNRRLLAGVLAVSVAYWGAIALLTIRDSRGEIDELFDRHLAHTALALLRVADPDDIELGPTPAAAGSSPAARDALSRWGELPERLAARRTPVASGPQAEAPATPGADDPRTVLQRYEGRMRYQVWTGEGELLLRSGNAPDAVMTRADGLSESVDAAGRTWRHYAVRDQHGDFRVVVSEDRALRDELVRGATLRMASPLAVGLPVLAALLWLAIRHALRPLGALAGEIAQRAPSRLAPLDAGSAPREVQPMVRALNALLSRVDDMLEGERRFTANAAHELRTPLAAIQAQLHLARTATTEAERRQAHDLLQQGLERGIRLVGQLLALARIDHDQALPDVGRVDLGALAVTVCAELAPAAIQRGQELELDAAPGEHLARGNADLLAALIANLVDNAIRYGHRGGHVGVRVESRANDVRIEVTDDGPGIAPALRERVFDRFFRASHDQSGTGLGLALCQRIAELHGSRIELSDPPAGHGLRAGVTLAAWASAATSADTSR